MRAIICASLDCGVEFGLPDHVYNQAQNNPERWFQCPNGHRQHYTSSEVDRLRKEIDILKATVERRGATINSLEEQATKDERRVAYWKGIAHRKARR